MKRIGIGLLTAVLFLSFTSCAQNPAGDNPASGETSSSVSSTGSSLSSAADVSSASSDTSSAISGDSSTAPGSTTTTKAASERTTVKPPESGTTEPPVVHATLPDINIKGKTVELLTSDSPETEASQTAIARFKEAYGATLKMTHADWADLQTVLNSRVMADNAPDVVVVRNADMYTYQLNGILKDITGLIDYSTPLWKDIKASNDSLKLTDKQYVAVIEQWVGWFLWYNKSLMLDNGITDTPDTI